MSEGGTQSMEQNVILSVQDLDVKFTLRGQVLHAIRGVSLDVYKGESLAIVGEVPTGGVLVDGLGIGDVGNVVLRDRKHLSQDGLIIVVMAIDRDSGALVSGPDIISRGFVYVRENEDIIECSRELARNIVLSYGQVDGSEWQNMKNRIKDELHRYIFDKIKRNPMILPIIMEI